MDYDLPADADKPEKAIAFCKAAFGITVRPDMLAASMQKTEAAIVTRDRKRVAETLKAAAKKQK